MGDERRRADGLLDRHPRPVVLHDALGLRDDVRAEHAEVPHVRAQRRVVLALHPDRGVAADQPALAAVQQRLAPEAVELLVERPPTRLPVGDRLERAVRASGHGQVLPHRAADVASRCFLVGSPHQPSRVSSMPAISSSRFSYTQAAPTSRSSCSPKPPASRPMAGRTAAWAARMSCTESPIMTPYSGSPSLRSAAL